MAETSLTGIFNFLFCPKKGKKAAFIQFTMRQKWEKQKKLTFVLRSWNQQIFVSNKSLKWLISNHP